MKMIQTVTGPITPDELGYTLMHEHIYSSSIGVPENYPQLYRDDVDEVVIGDLNEMKSVGIKSVIEASPIDLGRDVKRLKAASEATGVHIVACTGWWQEFAPTLGRFTAEKIASLFIDDVQKGVGETGIKAGIIKAAMDREGLTPARDLLHRAVAIAAKETGAPVMLHSYPQAESGRHQLRILQEEGLDMSRVKIDHILETTDMDYIKWVADQGCWIGVDRLPLITFPGNFAVSTETRIKTIKRMIDAGMSDIMLLSHDFMSISTMFDTLPEETLAYVKGLNPERFLFLHNVVFPKLVEMGVDLDLLMKMSTENPKRFFEGN